MSAHKYLEAITAAVARLEESGFEILEARYEQPHHWCLVVQKEQEKLEVCYERDNHSFSLSRFRKSAMNVEYWDKPELISATEDSGSVTQLFFRIEREIAAHFQKGRTS